MESPPLTFAMLEQRIQNLPLHPSYRASSSRRMRWGNAIGMAAGVVMLVCYKLLPDNPLKLWVAITLAVIELVAFAVAWTADLSSFDLRPSRERGEFAEVLDFDFPHHEALVTWLTGFPRDRLQAMSAFASFRLDRLQGKLPLLTGSIDRLGILPVGIALFVQFRHLQWPLRVSWVEIGLFVFLMLVYGLSLLQMTVRFRLDLYDQLLKKALAASPVSTGH